VDYLRACGLEVEEVYSTSFESVILAEARAAAERTRDTEPLRELNALDLSPRTDGSLPIGQVQALRRISRRYNGMWCCHQTLDVMTGLAALAPEYDDADVEAFRAGSGWIAHSPLIRDIVQTVPAQRYGLEGARAAVARPLRPGHGGHFCGHGARQP
jgi:hypothetical protein